MVWCMEMKTTLMERLLDGRTKSKQHNKPLLIQQQSKSVVTIGISNALMKNHVPLLNIHSHYDLTTGPLLWCCWWKWMTVGYHYCPSLACDSFFVDSSAASSSFSTSLENLEWLFYSARLTWALISLAVGVCCESQRICL